MNIVGIGKAGVAIANEFEKYPQYKAFYVDIENDKKYKNFIKVEEQQSHEEYEDKYKKLNTKNIKGETTVILCGAGKVTGIALRFLEQLKKQKTSVLYVKSDPSTMSEKEKLRSKVTFGILQQYARSGLLDKLYVVSNLMVESVLESVSIPTYWADINKIISSTFHMLNVFSNTEPLLTTLSDPGQTSRICTLGVVGYNTFNEKLFYDLQKTRLKKYFFGICQDTLNEEKDLLQKIRSYVKEKSDMEEKCTACFSIYTTEYEKNYVYTAHYASMIQEENLIDN